jgi:hypothetical protein
MHGPLPKIIKRLSFAQVVVRRLTAMTPTDPPHRSRPMTLANASFNAFARRTAPGLCASMHRTFEMVIGAVVAPPGLPPR